MRGADRERVLELAGEIGQRLSHGLQEVVPPEAQAHLLNAQRELLTALILIYEHQVGARRPASEAPSGRRRAAPRKRSRVQRIEVV